MRSLAAESAVPCGLWPDAQKKCFGFVRSVVRDEAADAPNSTVSAASAASTRTRLICRFPPGEKVDMARHASPDRMKPKRAQDPRSPVLDVDRLRRPHPGSTTVSKR